MDTIYHMGSFLEQSNNKFGALCGTPSFDLEFDLEGQRSRIRSWSRRQDMDVIYLLESF